MKYILILLSALLLSGCYDYVELNDLSIISSIAIDYNSDDNYVVNFEILNDQKKSDGSTNQKSLIVSGNGKSLSLAITNTMKKCPKQAYFSHLKLLLIDEEIANNKFKELIEYFLRNPNIRNEFYLVLTKDIESSKILEMHNDESPVISEKVNLMIDHSQKSSNVVTTKNFEDVTIDVLAKGKDASIPVISINNDEIQLSGIALFREYDYVISLDGEESILFNLLDGKVKNAVFNFSCPDNNKTIDFSIFKSSNKIKITDNKIVFNITLMAEIEQYYCDLNIKDDDAYKNLGDYYSEVMKDKLQEFYLKFKSYKSDGLGIGKKLYNKSRIYNQDDWLNLDHKFLVDFKINKDGLIFEVNDGN